MEELESHLKTDDHKSNERNIKSPLKFDCAKIPKKKVKNKSPKFK
jgi:hypothetical protein